MSVRRTVKGGAKSSRSGSGNMVAWLGLFVGLVNLVLLLLLLGDRFDTSASEISETSVEPESGSPAYTQVLAEGVDSPDSQGEDRVAEESAASVKKEDAPAMADLKPVVSEKKSSQDKLQSQNQDPVEPLELALPESARVGIRLQVLNGVGERLLAAKVGNALLKMRYDIREKGNTDQRPKKSLILCRGNDRSAGLRLAADLGLAPEQVSLKADKRLVDVDLTLIVGSDWKRLRLSGL